MLRGQVIYYLQELANLFAKDQQVAGRPNPERNMNMNMTFKGTCTPAEESTSAQRQPEVVEYSRQGIRGIDREGLESRRSSDGQIYSH